LKNNSNKPPILICNKVFQDVSERLNLFDFIIIVPKGDENLIPIGNQMSIPESLRPLKNVKRVTKKFIDFFRHTNIEFYKPKLFRKEKEKFLY